jgi:hypothetical protein
MSIHKHYLFPPEFDNEFITASHDSGRPINIEDFSIAVDMNTLPGYSDYHAFNSAWVDAWSQYFQSRVPGSSTRREVMEHAMQLARRFGLEN